MQKLLILIHFRFLSNLIIMRTSLLISYYRTEYKYSSTCSFIEARKEYLLIEIVIYCVYKNMKFIYIFNLE